MDVAFNLAMLVVDLAAFALLLRSSRLWHAIGSWVALSLVAVIFATLASSLPWSHRMFWVMRVVSWTAFLHGPAICLAAFFVVSPGSQQRGVALLGASLAAIGVDAFFIEPIWLEISHISRPIQGLNAPTRIAVIADFQTDHIGRYQADVLSRVSELKPDMVLWPGDYLQAPESEMLGLGAEFKSLVVASNLLPAGGMFAVEGNVDWRGDWRGLMRSVGAEPLPILGGAKSAGGPTSVKRGELWLTGLTLDESFATDLAVQRPEPGVPHIVFGHGPDFALGKIDADLMVAGHTHGGQVQLPFFGPLLTLSSVPRAWAHGVTDLDGGKTLVVSRGVGLERGSSPRLRFLCRPEVVIIDLVPDQAL